ncbi:hypothetical protein Cgig2_006281 [Carnegiea gigantea]|uniref:Uncharacterized protein n=1 Tax=Carnegiea gigantea TaxID=171969 RepID=A0A9Q1GHZ2_9CARY|nr:hypothetical protein Cgig2_006281 [Carnegiea gigantea]
MIDSQEANAFKFVVAIAVDGVKCAGIDDEDVEPKITYWRNGVLCCVVGPNLPLLHRQRVVVIEVSLEAFFAEYVEFISDYDIALSLNGYQSSAVTVACLAILVMIVERNIRVPRKLAARSSRNITTDILSPSSNSFQDLLEQEVILWDDLIILYKPFKKDGASLGILTPSCILKTELGKLRLKLFSVWFVLRANMAYLLLVGLRPKATFMFCDIWVEDPKFENVVQACYQALPNISDALRGHLKMLNRDSFFIMILIIHNCADKRRNIELIISLYSIHVYVLLNSKVKLRDMKQWLKVMTKFYTSLLGRQLKLCHPFTNHEIRDTIFSIANTKRPSPFGYSCAFFKACWSSMGSRVSIAIDA